METGVVSLAEIEKRVPRVVQQAQEITVNDADDYEFACTFLQLLAQLKNEVSEGYDSIVKKAHETWQEALGKRKKHMDPLLKAEGDVKLKVGQFRLLEERKRRAEEQRLADIAKKEADERAMAEAAQLAANGEKELADIVIQEAVAAPAPVVVLESSVPRQEGISGRVNWDFRITDESQLPREFMSPDPVKIRAVVRSQKGMTKIPGVQAFPVHSVSVRSA